LELHQGHHLTPISVPSGEGKDNKWVVILWRGETIRVVVVVVVVVVVGGGGDRESSSREG